MQYDIIDADVIFVEWSQISEDSCPEKKKNTGLKLNNLREGWFILTHIPTGFWPSWRASMIEQSNHIMTSGSRGKAELAAILPHVQG